MSERQLAMKIRKYDFALLELNLYLDTHPECRKALNLFSEYRKLKSAAEKEYIDRFGPMNTIATQSDISERWSWIDEPWPWERS